MRIWHISDTHGLHARLSEPQADMVIHTGDWTYSRKLAMNCAEHNSFMEWFSGLRAPYKICVPGNHDFAVTECSKEEAPIPDNVTLLVDEGIEIEDLYIVGVPWTRRWGRWAYQLEDEYQLANKFNRHSSDLIDVLATHGPPSGFLDERADGRFVGSTALRDFIFEQKVRATLCGHIHNEHDVINTGVIPISPRGQIVSNGAVVSNTSCRLFTGNLIDITGGQEILYTPGKFIEAEF